MTLKLTDTKQALSILKDIREDIDYSINNESSQINVSVSYKKDVEYIIHIIKMLESDYERLYDKIAYLVRQRARIIGHDNLKEDEIAITLITLMQSEQSTNE